MISILSAIVLMLAIGTLVQRQDLLSDLFGDSEPDDLALVSDEISVSPDTLTRVDVLENDTGLPDDAAERLEAVGQPGCGRVFVQAGAIQFLAENDCEAVQQFQYGIAGLEADPGVVTVRVIGATGIRNAPEPSHGGGIALTAPRPAGGEAVSVDSKALVVADDTAPARPLPTINVPSAATQPVAPVPDQTELAAAPRPAAPGPSNPRPIASQPSVPGSAAAPGLAAPSLPRSGLGGGLALADTSPTIGTSRAPSAPISSGAIGASSAPSVPTIGGLGAPSAPSAPGGVAISAPAPSVPGGGSQLALAQPPSPASPSIGRSSPAPATPGPASPSAPSATGGATGPAAPSIGGLSSPSVPSSGFPSPSGPSSPAAPTIGTAPSGSGSGPSIGAPAAPSAPRIDTRTLIANAPEPTAPAGIGGGLSVPSAGGSGAAASLASREQSVAPTVPGHGGAPQPGSIRPQATPTLALARVEVPTQIAAPSRDAGETLELAGVEENAETTRTSNLSVGSVATGGAAVAFAAPTSGLRDLMELRDTMSAIPLIDTTGPDALVRPDLRVGQPGLEIGALSPNDVIEPLPGRRPDAVRPEADQALPEDVEIAALPRGELACVVPPSITLDVASAGETLLMITSPCHADSVAELSYHDMRFGVRIDRTGRGEIKMLGFETSSDATLVFADDETLEFSVPFTGVERAERVALTWDAPILLGLHAVEFGSDYETDGHVRTDMTRDFRSVRRRGGGYMTVFTPIEGVGDHVQIYSHWVRRGGKTGVVKMYVDFTSRHRDRLPAACGRGEHARPSFSIIRSSRGRVEEPNTRRLGAIACDDVAEKEGDDPLIGAAVRDIIISQR
ncbi:MAG: hypothetical protein AAF675_01435 [Pseudomonadota bacterium]